MRAYITLLSNKDYLLGVIGLYRSLLSVGAKYPFYCALSCSVGKDVEQCLENEGIGCIRLSRTAYKEDANSSAGNHGHWNFTFDKLLIWELVQFEKLVFLDSDMIVLRNIDSLFDCKPFSAVSADCSFPGNEGWAGGLNSGLMVVRPDENVAKELCALAGDVIATFRNRGASVGDQDVIKEYCNWWTADKSLHLDEGYNIFADHLYHYVKSVGYSLEADACRPVYVVHFVGKRKPWMRKGLKGWLWLLKRCACDAAYRSVYNKYVVLLNKR